MKNITSSLARTILFFILLRGDVVGIAHSNKSISEIYNGTTPITSVYRGYDLIWGMGSGEFGVIYGNSIQSGVPSASAPIPYKSVGDLVTSGSYAGLYAIKGDIRSSSGSKKGSLIAYIKEPLRRVGNVADELCTDGTIIRNICAQRISIVRTSSNFINGFTATPLRSPKNQLIFSTIAKSTSTLPSSANRGYAVAINSSLSQIMVGPQPQFSIANTNDIPRSAEIINAYNYFNDNAAYVYYAMKDSVEESASLINVPCPILDTDTITWNTEVIPIYERS